MQVGTCRHRRTGQPFKRRHNNAATRLLFQNPFTGRSLYASREKKTIISYWFKFPIPSAICSTFRDLNGLKSGAFVTSRRHKSQTALCLPRTVSKLLTNEIHNARSVADIEQVLGEHQQLDAVHITAMLSSATFLLGSYEVKSGVGKRRDDFQGDVLGKHPAHLADRLGERLLNLIVEELHRVLPRLSGQGLATCLHCFAKLDFHPDPLVDELVKLAGHKCGEFTHRQVTDTLWALAKLGAHPGHAWMRAFMQKTRGTLPLCTSKDLALLVYALAQLQHHPNDDILKQIFVRWEYLAKDANAQDVCNLLWGFAVLRISPPQHWLDYTLQRFFEQHSCDPLQLSTVLWALSKMKFNPGPHFMNEVHHESKRSLHRICSQSTSVLLVAFARMRISCPAHFVNMLITSTPSMLERSKPQEMANTIWALVKLGVPPKPSWLQQFTAISRTQMSDFTPCSLTNIVWAFASFGFYPGHQWMSSFFCASHAKLCFWGRTSLCSLSWALATLKPTSPPQAWMQQYLTLLYKKVADEDMVAYTHALYQIATWQSMSVEAWLAEFLEADRRSGRHENYAKLWTAVEALHSKKEAVLVQSWVQATDVHPPEEDVPEVL